MQGMFVYWVVLAVIECLFDAPYSSVGALTLKLEEDDPYAHTGTIDMH